jgi:hypothetical protein
MVRGAHWDACVPRPVHRTPRTQLEYTSHGVIVIFSVLNTIYNFLIYILKHTYTSYNTSVTNNQCSDQWSVQTFVWGLKMAILWAETCRRSNVFFQQLIYCVWLCTPTNIVWKFLWNTHLKICRWKFNIKVDLAKRFVKWRTVPSYRQMMCCAKHGLITLISRECSWTNIKFWRIL